MSVLVLDTLTASVVIVDLALHGNDLSTLGQAFDEEWKRHSVDPRTGTKNLMSTMGNRQDCPPTGHTYLNAQLLKPHPVRAEKRPIAERFLRGKPLMAGELIRTEDGYRFDTALLRVSQHVVATIDRERGICSFYLMEGSMPQTTMIAAAGRTLGSVAEIGHGHNLVITGIRTAPEDEMGKVLGHAWTEGLVIETEIPKEAATAFDAIFFGEPSWAAR